MDERDRELALLSCILQARLTQKHIRDWVVMTKGEFLDPDQIDDHFGRFVGYFDRRPKGELCFILFVREDLAQGFSHVFGYYLNAKFFKIPKSEYEGPLAKTNNPIIKSLINIDAEGLPAIFYPSILVQFVVLTIGMPLVMEPKLYRKFRPANDNPSICLDRNAWYPTCNPTQFPEDASSVLELIKNRGFIVQRFDLHRPSLIRHDADLVMALYNKHIVYLIHRKMDRHMLVLLSHRAQFRHEHEVLGLQNTIQSALGSHMVEFSTCRLYDSKNGHCNGVIALQACALALNFPYTSIRDHEIEAILRELPLDQPIYTRPTATAPPEEYQLAVSEAVTDPGTPESNDGYHNLITDDEASQQEAVVLSASAYEQDLPPMDDIPMDYSQGSSQATIIMGEDEIARQLEAIALSHHAKDVLALPYPVDNLIEPRDDPRGLILDCKHFYFDQLRRILNTFVAYTTASTINPVSLSNIATGLASTDSLTARFIVVPIIDDGNDALVVVDRHNEEWAYLNPDNIAWKDREKFAEIEAHIGRSASILSNYVGLAINMTSYYHIAYPRMHLLMALFYLSKAFRYALVLPRKLIYREKDFRGYCHAIFSELAHANETYNREKGLILSNGYLASGAFRYKACPVLFERAVVNEGQCIFCLEKLWRNSGAHMSMKHGGYGLKNRERRRWRDSL